MTDNFYIAISISLSYFLLFFVNADITTEEIQYLNELPVDKLLKLKNSLKDLVITEFSNVTATDPTLIENFGAQAMAFRAPPIKRVDYEDGLYQKGSISKISNIFSMSVTTLAFLAFGGYLLCLIVQAVKSKQVQNMATVPTPSFFVNAGIKRPQSQFASYGRKKRDKSNVIELNLPHEELFSALLQLCEGYAQWSNMDV